MIHPRRFSRRILGVSLLVLLSSPVFYAGLKRSLAFVKEPELYAGDQIESRKCRECGGTGKDEDLARQVPELGDRCPFCRGQGMVKVVLPGPARPTRLWGTVVGLKAGGDALAFHAPRNLRRITPPALFGQAKGPDIPGAIAGARIELRKEGAGGEAIEVQTDPTGRFSRRLTPGTYRAVVRAPGFEPVQGEIEVPILTVPIWLEKATLVREPESPDEARSIYGLAVIAGLERAGGEGGFLRVEPGSP